MAPKKKVGGPIESGENVCKKYAKNAALRTEKKRCKLYILLFLFHP